MSKASDTINKSRKIVLKIGSNVLTGDDGKIDESIVEDIVDQVSELIKGGKQVALVSSGAEASGLGVTGLWSRHGDMNFRQAMCAVGQVELMMAYKRCFEKIDTVVGQILLTWRDFADEQHKLHVRNTLFTLIDEGVVPVINENDSINVDELTLGDNDRLAALTASLWNADLLIMMSDIDGLYDRPPGSSGEPTLIHEVEDLEEMKRNIDISGKSELGTGGMQTKIEAAEEVRKYGMPMLLVNGKQKGVLTSIKNGTETGTFFHS